ncbi:hypothetical protein MA092_003906 [Salmonella enterica]|nr:hypothetical protein [Salmonella enterica]
MPVNFLSEDQKAGYGNYHGEMTKKTLARYFHPDDFERMTISENGETITGWIMPYYYVQSVTLVVSPI